MTSDAAVDLSSLEAPIQLKGLPPESVDAQQVRALALLVRESSDGVVLASELDEHLWQTWAGEDFSTCVRREKVSAKPAAITRLSGVGDPGSEHYRPMIALVGLADASRTSWRKAATAVARWGATEEKLTTLGQVPTEHLEAVVEGLLLASYRPTRWGKKAESASKTEDAPDGDAPDSAEAAPSITLLGAHSTSELESVRWSGWATLVARFIADMPSQLKNPAWVAEMSQQLVDQVNAQLSSPLLEIKIWNVDQLHADGMGAILAVGGGSASEPRLVQISYAGLGAGAEQAPIDRKSVV